jgi:hypothetical protein
MRFLPKYSTSSFSAKLDCVQDVEKVRVAAGRANIVCARFCTFALLKVASPPPFAPKHAESGGIP